jgi:hypothetical protein
MEPVVHGNRGSDLDPASDRIQDAGLVKNVCENNVSLSVQIIFTATSEIVTRMERNGLLRS